MSCIYLRMSLLDNIRQFQFKISNIFHLLRYWPLWSPCRPYTASAGHGGGWRLVPLHSNHSNRSTRSPAHKISFFVFFTHFLAFLARQWPKYWSHLWFGPLCCYFKVTFSSVIRNSNSCFFSFTRLTVLLLPWLLLSLGVWCAISSMSAGKRSAWEPSSCPVVSSILSGATSLYLSNLSLSLSVPPTSLFSRSFRAEWLPAGLWLVEGMQRGLWLAERNNMSWDWTGSCPAGIAGTGNCRSKLWQLGVPPKQTYK